MQRDRYLTVIRPRASDIRNDSSWPVLPLKKRKKKEENLSLFLSLIGRNHPGKVFDSNDLTSFDLSFLSFLPFRIAKPKMEKSRDVKINGKGRAGLRNEKCGGKEFSRVFLLSKRNNARLLYASPFRFSPSS